MFCDEVFVLERIKTLLTCRRAERAQAVDAFNYVHVVRGAVDASAASGGWMES